MLRKRRVWITLLLLVLATSVAGYFYFTNNLALARAENEATGEVQTAIVRRGSIVVSATGAGTMVPAEEVELSFASSGSLVELVVQVGDRVEAGDVLARIDDSDAQKALADAQLQLAEARMQTDAAATTMGVSYDEIAIAQAEIGLSEAQAALGELLNWAPDEDEIALAQAELDAAESSYSAAVGQQSSTVYSIETARINLEQAQRDLADAQEAYDNTFDPARDWERNIDDEREAATRSLQRAQDNLAIAEANYNSVVASSASSSPASAQTSILSAQQALEETQNGPTEDEIATAQAEVRQAELALQQAQLNQEAHALSLSQAELAVAEAEAALEATTLVAPIAGTVMSVDANVGENVSGPIIVLADLSTPMLELFLDETDLDKVGLNYEVDVIFDAFPEETFTGQVVTIDPQLYEESGVSAVRALVAVDYDNPQPLPIGLNGTIDVIGGRAENALLVPVEAVREIAPGQYAVFVMEGGEPQLQMVEVGLMDYTYAEIVSGLEEGDVVTTGVVETGQ